MIRYRVLEYLQARATTLMLSPWQLWSGGDFTRCGLVLLYLGTPLYTLAAVFVVFANLCFRPPHLPRPRRVRVREQEQRGQAQGQGQAAQAQRCAPSLAAKKRAGHTARMMLCLCPAVYGAVHLLRLLLQPASAAAPLGPVGASSDCAMAGSASNGTASGAGCGDCEIAAAGSMVGGGVLWAILQWRLRGSDLTMFAASAVGAALCMGVVAQRRWSTTYTGEQGGDPGCPLGLMPCSDSTMHPSFDVPAWDLPLFIVACGGEAVLAFCLVVQIVLIRRCGTGGIGCGCSGDAHNGVHESEGVRRGHTGGGYLSAQREPLLDVVGGGLEERVRVYASPMEATGGEAEEGGAASLANHGRGSYSSSSSSRETDGSEGGMSDSDRGGGKQDDTGNDTGDGGGDDDEVSPEERSGLLSRLMFLWIVPLLWRGYKEGSVGIDDLPPLAHGDKAANITETFDRVWEREARPLQAGRTSGRARTSSVRTRQEKTKKRRRTRRGGGGSINASDDTSDDTSDDGSDGNEHGSGDRGARLRAALLLPRKGASLLRALHGSFYATFYGSGLLLLGSLAGGFGTPIILEALIREISLSSMATAASSQVSQGSAAAAAATVAAAATSAAAAASTYALSAWFTSVPSLLSSLAFSPPSLLSSSSLVSALNAAGGIQNNTHSTHNYLISSPLSQPATPPLPPHSWTRAYLLACGLFACSVTQTLLVHSFWITGIRCGMHTQVALMSAVYKKSQRLAPGYSGEFSSVGAMTNLMSTDCCRIADNYLVPALHWGTWSAAITICVSVAFLWHLLGVSCLAGVGATLLLSWPPGVYVEERRTESEKRDKTETIRKRQTETVEWFIEQMKDPTTVRVETCTSVPYLTDQPLPPFIYIPVYPSVSSPCLLSLSPPCPPRVSPISRRYVSRRIQKVSGDIQRLRDRRSAAMENALQSMSFLKAASWEPWAAANLFAVRDRELSRLRVKQLYGAVNSGVVSAAQILAPLLSFMIFALLSTGTEGGDTGGKGRTLDAPTAFASLAWFNLMRGPLGTLPWAVSALMDTLGTIRTMSDDEKRCDRHYVM